MQGSFDVSAARLYYDSHGLPAPVGSEEPLFNFASTALSSPKEAKVPPMKKVSPMDGKMEKAKRVLKEAEERFKENSSPENEDLMYRAQMLYSEVEVKYAEEQDRLQEELQYSENYDAYDFTRCVRPDGTVYGSRGRCRKGTESSSETLDPKKVWADLKPRVEKLKPRKEEEVRRQDGTMIGDSPRNMAIRNIKEYHNRLLDSRSPAETKLLKDLLEKSLDKMEGGSPSKPKEKAKEQKPDKEWEAKRKETLKSMKGMTKSQVLNLLNQHKKVHGMSNRDSLRDLKAAVVGAIHGDKSPSEIQASRASKVAAAKRRRDAKEAVATAQQPSSKPKSVNIERRLKEASKSSTNRAAEILKELDRLPKGDDSPKKEKLLEEYFRLYGTAPAPPKKISDPVPKILEAQRKNKQFNDEENKRITALAEAGKIKGVDPGAVQRIRARKIMDRINQESDPVKQRQLIRQLEEINNPLVKLPDGRVARSWEPKSPYEV